MEAALLSSSIVTTGNKGDLTPFLEKIYDIVNDPNTDEIVSWSSTNNSFVVWNPTEFACFILPTYFKHNNFSSFTRQLNTYGFQKIDFEHWKYANEKFIKDQKQRLDAILETMQKNLLNLFEKALQNPSFVGQLSPKFASGG